MSLAHAIRSLQRQSREHGFGGIIGDLAARLCEDGQTVMLAARFDYDYPLMASFMLEPGDLLDVERIEHAVEVADAVQAIKIGFEDAFRA